MEIIEPQKTSNSINNAMNNYFTKIQTIGIVAIGIIIAWGGVVFLLRGERSMPGASVPGGVLASQNIGDNFAGLPQNNNLPQEVKNAPVISPALAKRLPARGVIAEIKDTELSLKLNAAQGKQVEDALRKVTFSAKTKFVERTLKPSSEISAIMQEYISEQTAKPDEDIPFPQTYLSEREIAKDELKAGDTVSIFAKDTGKEVITADIVARITNP